MRVLKDVWVSFLGSAWSLSTEWQFYVLALLTASHSRRLCWMLLGLAVAGVGWHLASPDAWHFSRAFLPNKGHFFALGVASVPLVRQEPGAAWRYGLVAIGCLAICATEGSIGKILPPTAWTLFLIVQIRPEIPGLDLAGRLLRSQFSAIPGSDFLLPLFGQRADPQIGQRLTELGGKRQRDIVHAAMDTRGDRSAGAGLGLAACAYRSASVALGPHIRGKSGLVQAGAVCAGSRRRDIEADNETSSWQPSRRLLSSSL